MTSEAGAAANVPSLDGTERCPCGSGDVFGSCCGPLLDGVRPAPTAERLMRSRYTAFVRRDTAYLRETWHPTTRPAEVETDLALLWRRLVVLDRVDGGPFDDRGVVEFQAHWVEGGQRGVLHERSRFVRDGRRWFYVDGEVR